MCMYIKYMHFFTQLIEWNCRLSGYQLEICWASLSSKADFQQIFLLEIVGRPLGSTGQDKFWQQKPVHAGRPASLRSFALKKSRESICSSELCLILLCQHLLPKKYSTSAFFFIRSNCNSDFHQKAIVCSYSRTSR